MKHLEELLILVGQMFNDLAENAETGEWPHKTCQYCHLKNEGYHYDYHYTEHEEHCFTRKNKQFQEWLREAIGEGV